jgi:hypothetical protein
LTYSIQILTKVYQAFDSENCEQYGIGTLYTIDKKNNNKTVPFDGLNWKYYPVTIGNNQNAVLIEPDLQITGKESKQSLHSR